MIPVVIAAIGGAVVGAAAHAILSDDDEQKSNNNAPETERRIVSESYVMNKLKKVNRQPKKYNDAGNIDGITKCLGWSDIIKWQKNLSLAAINTYKSKFPNTRCYVRIFAKMANNYAVIRHKFYYGIDGVEISERAIAMNEVPYDVIDIMDSTKETDITGYLASSYS